MLSFCTGHLSIVDLRGVLEIVWNFREKWYDVGFHLEMSRDILDTITRIAETSDSCVIGLCKVWLKREKPRATYEALTQALKVGCGHHVASLLPHPTDSKDIIGSCEGLCQVCKIATFCHLGCRRKGN